MKKLIVNLIILTFSTSVYSQITFEKTYAGNSYYGVNVVVMPDEGYVICTAIKEGLWLNENIHVIKTDLQGDTLWTQSYGMDNNSERGVFINPTNDGGFVLCGVNEGDDYETIVYKIDSIGNCEWNGTFNFVSGFEVGIKVFETYESDYIILTNSDNSTLSKINNEGDVIWSKSYDYKLWDLKIMSSGNYIMVGNNEGNEYTENTIIINVDNNGNVIWCKEYDLGYSDRAYSIIESNNNLALCGMRNEFDTAPYDAFVMVTDINGDTIFTKQFGVQGLNFDERAFSICSSGSNYIVTGDDNSHVFLFKIDSLGDQIWTRELDGMRGKYVTNTEDGGFVIAGYYNSDKVILIKTDSFGNSTDLYVRIIDNTSIYPNPTQDKIFIQALDIDYVEVIDINGIIVYRGVETEIDLGSHSNGIYFIKIKSGNQIIIKKVIKE